MPNNEIPEGSPATCEEQLHMSHRLTLVMFFVGLAFGYVWGAGL